MCHPGDRRLREAAERFLGHTASAWRSLSNLTSAVDVRCHICSVEIRPTAFGQLRSQPRGEPVRKQPGRVPSLPRRAAAPSLCAGPGCRWPGWYIACLKSSLGAVNGALAIGVAYPWRAVWQRPSLKPSDPSDSSPRSRSGYLLATWPLITTSLWLAKPLSLLVSALGLEPRTY